MKLGEIVSWLMRTLQRHLFPRLEECWEGPLDVGTKQTFKGYKETWIGYKLHAGVSDCCLPISVALTAASVSASNRLEWSGGTDRTLGIGSDNFFGEIKLIALKDQNPAQESRSQSSQEAQDLQGLKGSHDTR